MSVVSTNFLGHFQVHGTCFLSQMCTWNKLKQKRKIALSAVSPEKKRKLLLAFTYTAPWNFLINICQVNKHINPTVSQGDSKWFCCQTPIFLTSWYYPNEESNLRPLDSAPRCSNHWVTAETLRWARSITKFIWHASCILLGSAMSIASCL